MKKTKRLCALLLALALDVALTACGSGGNNNNSSGSNSSNSSNNSSNTVTSDDPGDSASVPLVCLISEVPAGDPFVDLTWQGFEAIHANTGAEVRLVEALEPAEYEEQIRAMAEMGANPIYTMYDAVSLVALEIAGEYPDTKFIPIDCNEETTLDNVTCIVVDSFEPCFIAGIVAALTSETGNIAWIGSLDIGVINRFYDGFAAGIAYANEVYGTNASASKTFIGNAEDSVKGAETAKIVLDAGADVVAQAASQAGIGVLQACIDAGVKCIGVDKWQGDMDELVFWSALIAIQDAVPTAYNSYVNGEFNGVNSISYGISTGSPIYASQDYDELPDDIKTAVDEVMAGVTNGSVDVFSYEQ